MALRPLHAKNPVGSFDSRDSQLTSWLGGEVCSFVPVTFQGADQGAADLSDGYFGTGNKRRPAVTFSLTPGLRPLYLADEGSLNYGTLFGSVVGGQVGQQVTGGALLGPHTATGSGKVTLWGEWGIYGITLDAVDTTATTGLVPANATLQSGTPLYATTTGKLTPLSGTAFEVIAVARFIDFETDGSLVSTTKAQVSALNSPSGMGAALLGFTQVIINWQLET